MVPTPLYTLHPSSIIRDGFPRHLQASLKAASSTQRQTTKEEEEEEESAMADSSSKTSVEEEPAIAKSELPEAGDPAMAEPPTPPTPPLPDWELLSMSSLSNSASFDPPPPQTAVAGVEFGESEKKKDISGENPISTPLPTPPPPPPPLPDSPEPFSEGWKPRGIFSTASSDPPPLQPLHLVMDDSPSSPLPFPPRETLKEEEKEQEKGEEREEEEEAVEEEEEEGAVSMAAFEDPVQCPGGEKVGDSERGGGGGGKKGRAWTMPPPPPLWSIAIAAVAVVGLVCLWHHERSHDRSLLTQISSQNEHKATTVRAER